MLFEKVVDQHKIKEKLIEGVNQDRISHAQLFHDVNGYGALPLILGYVQYIFCQQKKQNDSCGECSSCVKVSKLAHPDLHFSFPIQLSSTTKISDSLLKEWKSQLIENPYFSEEDWNKAIGGENKTGVIGKDESESIVKKLQLKSFEGNYKIVIIYAIENMNVAAANKLLKLIEEPPAKTLFLMTAANLETILPTILSRSQLIKLKQPTAQEIESYLIKWGSENQTARDIAAFVNGNISEAISLSLHPNEEDEYFTLFVEWMRICFSRDVSKGMEFSTQLAAMGKENQKAFLIYCLGHFQKSLTANFISIKNVNLRESQLPFMEKFIPFINPSNIQTLYELFSDAYTHINRNANAKILFLDLSFKMFGQIKKG